MNRIQESYHSLIVIVHVFKPFLLLRIVSHYVNQTDSLRRLERGRGNICSLMFGRREDGTANFEKKMHVVLSSFLFAMFSSPSWSILPGVGNSYHRGFFCLSSSQLQSKCILISNIKQNFSGKSESQMCDN